MLNLNIRRACVSEASEYWYKASALNPLSHHASGRIDNDCRRNVGDDDGDGG
jgi:hypothetical protein